MRLYNYRDFEINLHFVFIDLPAQAGVVGWASVSSEANVGTIARQEARDGYALVRSSTSLSPPREVWSEIPVEGRREVEIDRCCRSLNK